MTTDAAVAEPEVVQTPETPAPITEETPSTQTDAATLNADAGAAPEPVTADIDAEVEAFVKEQTQKGSEQAKPESTRTEPQVDPEAFRYFQESAAAFDTGYKTRQSRLDTIAEKVDAGDISIAEGFRQAKDILNEHHADSKTKPEAISHALYVQNATMWNGFSEGIPQEHHEAIAQKLSEGKLVTFKDIAAEFYERGKASGASEGYAKGEEAGLRTGYRNGLTRKADLASLSSDGQSVNGTGGGGGTFSSEDALHTAWNDKAISRDVYAREYKRLTGRDL